MYVYKCSCLCMYIIFYWWVYIDIFIHIAYFVHTIRTHFPNTAANNNCRAHRRDITLTNSWPCLWKCHMLPSCLLYCICSLAVSIDWRFSAKVAQPFGKKNILAIDEITQMGPMHSNRRPSYLHNFDVPNSLLQMIRCSCLEVSPGFKKIHLNHNPSCKMSRSHLGLSMFCDI